VSMRLWVQEPEGKLKGPTKREYETVGYVISGRARPDLEGQTLNLKAGDSWLVPAGAMHHYTNRVHHLAQVEGSLLSRAQPRGWVRPYKYLHCQSEAVG